jgi:hypothetical protein
MEKQNTALINLTQNLYDSYPLLFEANLHCYTFLSHLLHLEFPLSPLPLKNLPPTSPIFQSRHLLLPFVFLPLLNLSLYTPPPNFVKHKSEAIPVTARGGT